MKQIPLSKGKFAIVDDGDYEWLMQWKWCYNSQYARRDVRRTAVWMHRLILGDALTDELICDHINRDKLDNRRSNLRAVTHSQNMKNRTCFKTKRFLGVFKNGINFMSMIGIPERDIYLGTFKSEEDAALAYNRAAKIHHGEFANLNNVVDDGRELISGHAIGRSGFRGVTKDRNTWRAEATVSGKKKYLGNFATPEEASNAYQQFKKSQ